VNRNGLEYFPVWNIFLLNETYCTVHIRVFMIQTTSQKFMLKSMHILKTVNEQYIFSIFFPFSSKSTTVHFFFRGVLIVSHLWQGATYQINPREHCNTKWSHYLIMQRIVLECRRWGSSVLQRWDTGWMNGVWVPAGTGNFSLHQHVQTGSGAHPASYPIGKRRSFPECKAAGAWNWPLTSSAPIRLHCVVLSYCSGM
jgi:hypothetical protein